MIVRVGARVVALVVAAAVLLAACSGGDGDDDAEGEAFIPPSTTEAPSDPLVAWGAKAEPLIRRILEASIDLRDALEDDDDAATTAGCSEIGDVVGDADAIGPMPGPVSGEWTATLDELGTGAGGCVAAVEAGDDVALREAFSHFDAALLHLTNVTNEIP